MAVGKEQGMTKARSEFVFVIMLAVIAGCASSAMRPLEPGRIPSAPAPGGSVIVFMRPSFVGGAIQSSVFDIRPDGDKFVGIVSSKTKVAYPTEPGQHLFMVIGENADFMRANLAPGKMYYALVTPRMGWWKARFSLRPVHRDEIGSEDFNGWDEATQFVENTEASRQWAQENWASIQDKKADYMRKWDQKSEADKSELTLQAHDGK
jgi:hypothetical protein